MIASEITEKAERFAVWRVGTQNDWECSYEDIALATGVSVAKVKRICLGAGWRCEATEFEDVDTIMRAENGVDVLSFHV